MVLSDLLMDQHTKIAAISATYLWTFMPPSCETILQTKPFYRYINISPHTESRGEKKTHRAAVAVNEMKQIKFLWDALSVAFDKHVFVSTETVAAAVGPSVPATSSLRWSSTRTWSTSFTLSKLFVTANPTWWSPWWEKLKINYLFQCWKNIPSIIP